MQTEPEKACNWFCQAAMVVLQLHLSYFISSTNILPHVTRHLTEELRMEKKAKLPATKPKAISVHIGLNAVSPTEYGGWSGELNACEFDAKDMAAIAKLRGMKSTVLLTKKGRRANVLAALRGAARQLAAGDLFFLTYSGHGGQVPDVTGEEEDKKTRRGACTMANSSTTSCISN